MELFMMFLPVCFFIYRLEGQAPRQPNYYERKAMLSEYSSGLDPLPAKRMKMRPPSLLDPPATPSATVSQEGQ